MLHIDGAFSFLPKYPESVPVLFGQTWDNGRITAFNCEVMQAQLPGQGTIKLRPTVIAHGAHIHCQSDGDFSLRKLDVRYSNCDEWADTYGFKVLRSNNPSTDATIEYAIPTPIRAERPDGFTIGVAFTVEGIPGRGQQSEIHIVQRAWITVSSSDTHTYSEFRREAGRFADLVSLAVGQPVRRLEMRGTLAPDANGTAGESIQTVQIVDNRKPVAQELPEVPICDMLFSLNDIRHRFAEVVELWFGFGEPIRPLYDLYFGTLRSPFTYVENRLLNLFQALESYHRRTHPPTEQQKSDNEKRIDRILKAVQADPKRQDDANWLRKRLDPSRTGPTADERLQALVSDNSAAWLLNETHSELATKYRNYYTHLSSSLQKDLSEKDHRPSKVHELAIRLQLLCEVILLRQTGFQDDRQRIKRANRLDRLGVPNDPLE